MLQIVSKPNKELHLPNKALWYVEAAQQAESVNSYSSSGIKTTER